MRSTAMVMEPRYIVLTLLCAIAMYLLSSLPGDGTTESHPLIQLLSNVAHAPLFAAFAFCLLKTFAAGQPLSRRVAVAVVLVAGTYAALDEWHQSFVPGRTASIFDFLVDLAGIFGMLLIVGFRSLREHHA